MSNGQEPKEPLPAIPKPLPLQPQWPEPQQDKDIISPDQLLRLRQPEVKLRRIRRFNTYEVLDSDLEDLDLASQEEKQALAFASLSLGGLISTAASWIGSSGITAKVTAVYVAATLILFIAALFFSITWGRQRKKHQALLDRIRTQTATFEETSLAQ